MAHSLLGSAIFLLLPAIITSLTCYNGMKLLSMQQVGTSTEECSGSAQCYNMSTTTGILVNVVKAGCSQWRCMLAKDTCIFTTFQYVPVSLCCCSWDRCNVAGNPVYSDNPNQMGGGGSNWGGNQGQGGFGGNQGGSSWNQNQGGGNMGQGQGQGGQNSGSNWGSSWGQATSAPNNNGWGTNTGSGSSGSNSGGQTFGDEISIGGGSGGDEPQMQKQQAKFDQSAPSKSGGKKWTKEELEKIFAKQIDDKADEIQLEGDFKKADPKYKASRPKV